MDLEGGGPPPSAAPVGNLAELVARAAAARPDATALVTPGAGGAERVELTWSELADTVRDVAAGLTAAGLVAGQRLVICGDTSVEFVVGYLAGLRAGLVAVPTSPRWSAERVQAVAGATGARLVLDAQNRSFVPASRPLTAAGLAALAAEGRSPVATPPDPEALAVLLFTAGAAEADVPAMMTHRALLAQLSHAAPLNLAGADTVAVLALPLSHVFGLHAVLGPWLYGGGRLVVVPDYPDRLVDLVAAEVVTHLPLVPAYLYRLLSERPTAESLASVTTVVCGAAPMPAALAEEFTARTGLRVERGYGLTEAAGAVTSTLGGRVLGQGHVGRPLPGVEVRIGEALDRAESGEPGAIWLRSDQLFSGYWPDGSGAPGPDGWFDTGDIGYLVDGELFVVDRAGELIVVNGFNVYPAEVEQVIGGLPGVRDVAVLGLPDERAGERIVAVVAGEGLTAGQVLEHCATRLARFKHPREVQLVAALPRGLTGRVNKGELRRFLVAR